MNVIHVQFSSSKLLSYSPEQQFIILVDYLVDKRCRTRVNKLVDNSDD